MYSADVRLGRASVPSAVCRRERIGGRDRGLGSVGGWVFERMCGLWRVVCRCALHMGKVAMA